MQKIRDLGFASKPWFTILYSIFIIRLETMRNLKVLCMKWKEKALVTTNLHMVSVFSAYAATCDVEGLDKTVTMMESDPNFFLDWKTFATAASGYAKAGFLDKALSMLKKSEGLIKMDHEKRRDAYNSLITQYATYGKKDEVLGLRELYKDLKIYNRGYKSVIPSVLKFDDLDTAEKIFKEWESRNLRYDFQTPNFLIGAYCRKGLLQKAESLINGAKLKGREA